MTQWHSMTRLATVRATREHARRPTPGWPTIILRVAASGLLIATAAIHLDLYLTGYRTIPTIGWLFLLQVIAAFALALAVLAIPVDSSRSADSCEPCGSHELVPRNTTPDTIAGWKAVAGGLLSDRCCAFHRNVEISSRYAWMYTLRPACFKWAAMAAIASHHVRLALFPLRLDTDRSGYVDIPHSLRRPKLLLIGDVNTIRATNNAIFDDLFWVHLAYVSADDGIDHLRALLQADRHYAPVLAGFEAIDQGRCVLEDQRASAQARQRAGDLIWDGNVKLLEHEQRALVQPQFDRLSRASAWLVSIGSATSFEVRGARQEIADFTSFYLYSFTRGIPHALRGRAWPRITRFEDRWRWLVACVVPRFRRFDADTHVVDASLRHIFDDARGFASSPCVLPRSPADGPPRATQPRLWHRPRPKA